MQHPANHRHLYARGAWPFEDPSSTIVSTSASVLRGDAPILLVFHSPDGDWQFLHQEVHPSDQCERMCLGCAFERDHAIGILADLPRGWMAYRHASGDEWVCDPYSDVHTDAGHFGHEAR